MRLLLLIPSLGPIYGGTSKITPAFARALAARGWSVDLVTTDANGPENLPVPLDGWIEQDGYRLRYFPRHGRAEFKPSAALLRWLWRRARDYDLVHITSDFNFPVLAGALACRWRRVPYVVNPQGMLEPWALRYKGWKKRLYYLLIERPLVLRGAAALQALNAPEAGHLAALELRPPVFTVTNGIDPLDARPDAADREAFLEAFPAARGKTVLLFLHRVDPKKGLDVLARAFATVRARFAQTHVVVAGPDNVGYAATARRLFEEAGCGDAGAVTFTGMLDGAPKRGAWAAATLFVAPSYSEGFSMSVLEAMSAGLPCVLTEGCNFPEAGAADAARIVPTGDADRFAAALCDLLAHPDRARATGERARELVLGRYTWPKVAEQFEGVARQILAPRRPAAA